MSNGTMIKTALYTPGQIFAGSFLGGPAASIIMLRRNFMRLREPAHARKTVIWGFIGTCVMFVAIYFLPKNFPNVVFPATYSALAQFIASTHQRSKVAIEQSDQYTRRSNWHVFWFGLLSLVISAAAFFFAIFAIVMIARSFR